MRLTFHYRTEGAMQLRFRIETAVGLPDRLDLQSATWARSPDVDFSIRPGADALTLILEITGMGCLWLDEVYLNERTQPALLERKLALPDAAADPVRFWASVRYWSDTADERLGDLRTAARTVNANFEIFTNGFHAVNADFFMTEDKAIELNAHRLDTGFFPGIHEPANIVFGLPKASAHRLTEPLLVTNIADYKFVHSQRVPEFFGYHMPLRRSAARGVDRGDPGFSQNLNYNHNPDSAVLMLAEAAAFGGGAGCDPLQRWTEENFYTDDEIVQVREAERRFWRFIHQHPQLYEGYRPQADVGIVFHDVPAQPPFDAFNRLMDLANGLASGGVLWDLLTENRCDAETFARYRILIFQDLARMSEAEVEAARAFLEAGGLILAARVVGDDDEWFRMRLPDAATAWPPIGLIPINDGNSTLTRARPSAFEASVGQGKLIYQAEPLQAKHVIVRAREHLNRELNPVTGMSEESLERLRLNAWVWQGSDNMAGSGEWRLTLHLVNYNVTLGRAGGVTQELQNVTVGLPLSPGTAVHSVVLYSPDNSGPTQVPFSAKPDRVVFTLPSLRIYTVAVVEDVPYLSITRSEDGEKVILSWSATATDFVLEASENLSPPVEWRAVNDVPVVVDGQNFVTRPAEAGQRFYRLRRP